MHTPLIAAAVLGGCDSLKKERGFPQPEVLFFLFTLHAAVVLLLQRNISI